MKKRARGSKIKSSGAKRLLKDLVKLNEDPPHGISASPQEKNLFHWEALIAGPSETIWQGGTFRLTLCFSDDYPIKPPDIRFVSKMFHPNIYVDGQICLDILKSHWSPTYDVAAVLTSIQSLLSDPNPRSPANGEAARLYEENRREYDRRVKSVVEESVKKAQELIKATSS